MRIALFVLIYLVCLANTQSVQEDLLDVALIVNPDTILDTSTRSMPKEVNLGIEFAQSNTPVNLHLKACKYNNRQSRVYVLRQNSHHKQTCVQENIPVDMNKGLYQDLEYGAAVEVTCNGMEKGVCDPLMTGSFNINGNEYDIQPIPETEATNSRVKRSILRRGWKKVKKLYAVFRNRKQCPTASDYKSRANKLQEEPSVALPMTRRDNVVSSGVRASAANEIPSPQITAGTSFPRGNRRKYTLGLLIAVDYAVYKRFYDDAEGSTIQERDIAAKEALREHGAYIVNGIDLRFKKFESMEFDIVVVGYIVNDKESENKWTDSRVTDSPRDMVDAEMVLNQLTQWRRDMLRDPARDIPRHDHLMLLTGYNLTVNLWDPNRDAGVAGYAYVGSTCRTNSVSVVEDIGGLDNILTAAHELAHSLNANHDGDENPCRPEDNFIMTPTANTDGSEKHKLYKFSRCSEEDIRSYISTLDRDNCLNDEAVVYDAEEFDNHLSIAAGQRYDPDEQCSRLLGYPSFFTSGNELSEGKESICLKMYCKNDQGPFSFNIFFAYRGTSCGNKKWCIDGVCTESPLAPERDENCVHGDSKRLFGDNNDLTCQQYIALNPHECYSGFYSTSCCASCKKIERQNATDCRFGDRVDGCIKHRHCGIQRNLRNCCGTCSDFPVNVDPLIVTKKPIEDGPVTPPTPPTRPTDPPSSRTTKRQRTTPKTVTTKPKIVTTTSTTRSTTPFPDPVTRKTTLATQTQSQAAGTELCLDRNAQFFRISCNWISRTLISSQMCSWSLFRSCCVPCPKEPVTPPIQTTTVKVNRCIDEDICRSTITSGASCYVPSLRRRCCATCQRFRDRFELPGCIFGDQNNKCSLLYRRNPIFTCTRRLRNICCWSCRDFPTTTSRPTLMTTFTSTPMTTTTMTNRRRLWRQMWSRRRRWRPRKPARRPVPNSAVQPKVDVARKEAHLRKPKRKEKKHKRKSKRLFGRKRKREPKHGKAFRKYRREHRFRRP